MRDTKQKQIGDRGIVYHVSQLGARQGGRVIVRLTKMVGTAIGDAVGADEAEFSMSSFGRLVGGLADKLTEDDFDWLCNTFTKGTQVEIEQGKIVPLEKIFDMHFAGQYAELGAWLLFAVEVNFASFLPGGGIGTWIEKRLQALEKVKESEFKSASPSTSEKTGQSGE